MFAIGDKEWPGVSKAMEEMGELLTVFGKLMGSRGDVNHWSGNLMDKIYEELPQVQAALDFLVEANKLDQGRITLEYIKKFQQYWEWHKTDPALPVVDTSKKNG